MNASHFEFQISIPADARFAATVRQVAVHAAQYAGCPRAEAEAFGHAVEAAVQGILARPGSGGEVPIMVRRDAGPIEVIVDGRLITLDM